MRKVFLSLLLSSSALVCHAEPPTTESVEALLAATKSESILDTLSANMEQTLRTGMTQSMAGRRITPQQQSFLDNAPQQFAALIKEELTWAHLKPMYVQLYQESFTQEEVDGLLAFYRSPAGEALTKKMPVVAQKTLVLVQQRVQPMLERMKVLTAKAMAEAQQAK